ncbi:YigZ family protein [Methanolobus sp. WCC4]|uniref:YigZ family protein n=1 Tax=Methanolobus sp. WCC4 TaxID=3125784 RepID=UPI0030F6F2F4
MPDFRTLKEQGYAQTEIKNSTFIAYASPVNDEREAKEFIDLVKSKHNDANHNVSAYLINQNNVLAMKYDDDGEPAGSSGKPVFRVLEMKELSNVVVVVSRYFGGIRLGFGGLSRAYREAAVEAIEAAGIIEIHERTRIEISSDYSDMDTVIKLVEEYSGNILKTDYADIVNFAVEVDSEHAENFIEKVINVTRNRVTVK